MLLSQIPETIDVPALVKLAGTLTGNVGLTISSNDVTIDLGGHALVGNKLGTDSGINLNGARQHISILNGVIRNWGGDGVSGGDDDGLVIHDLQTASNNGSGIVLRHAALVESCVARANGADGIRLGDNGAMRDTVADSNGGDGLSLATSANVSGCSSRLSGGDGIQVGSHGSVVNCTVTEAGENGTAGNNGIVTGTVTTIADCTVRGATGDGINAGGGSNVTRCTVASNGGDGIQLADEAVATGCLTNANTGDGVLGAAKTTISKCHAIRNAAAGIHVTGIRNKIDANNVAENARGIDVDTTTGNNLVIRNSASGNPVATSAANYDVADRNKVGPIVTDPAAAASTNPHANYSY